MKLLNFDLFECDVCGLVGDECSGCEQDVTCLYCGDLASSPDGRRALCDGCVLAHANDGCEQAPRQCDACEFLAGTK